MPILIAHADADEEFAQATLVGPLRAAGFRVFHGGDILVGESPQVEVGKVLERGGVVVVCGTSRSAGSRTVRQYVRSARARSAGVRVFGVQMEPDADLEPLALDGKVAAWWEGREKAFDDLVAALCRHGSAGVSDDMLFSPVTPEATFDLSFRQSGGWGSGDAVFDSEGFGMRVADACRDRYPDSAVRLVPEYAGHPAYLAVMRRDEQGIPSYWPVGLAPDGLDDDVFERFVEVVHARYEHDDSRVVSEIVFSGDLVDETFVRRARRRGVKVWSLVEYEKRWDPRPYLDRQIKKLSADLRYPPELYVPQRYLRLDEGNPSRLPFEPNDLLGATLGWLDSEAARLVVVLGDFGYGKSFLLRQLARLIPAELPHLVPMLVELRDLDKANDFDVLLAQHLAKAGEDRIEIRAVRQMLERGQVALLFDGFDELALRITYDEASAHLRTVLSSA